MDSPEMVEFVRRTQAKVHNCVCTAHLTNPINTEQLRGIFHAQGAKRGFASVVIKIVIPPTTVCLFESGCCNTLGAASVEQALMSQAMVLWRFYRETGIHLTYTSFAVSNIVCAAQCEYRVDRQALADANPDRVIYLPHVFEGAQYLCTQLLEDNTERHYVCIVFGNGKVIVTGGRNEYALMSWFKEVEETVLCNFKDTSEPRKRGAAAKSKSKTPPRKKLKAPPPPSVPVPAVTVPVAPQIDYGRQLKPSKKRKR